MILGVIPARFASTRFPGKPLVDLGGKPMIQRVWERALLARSLDKVLVATDDRRIAAVARAFGAEAVMTPASCPTGTDRIARALRGRPLPDVVVNLQGDEPFLRPSQVDQLVSLLKRDPGAAMATLAHPFRGRGEWQNPNAVKVVVDARGRALYFSRSGLPFPRGLSKPWESPSVGKHIGLYAYRGWFLRRFTAMKPTPLEKAESLEQLRALESGFAIQVGFTRAATLSVDTPQDAGRARQLLKRDA